MYNFKKIEKKWNDIIQTSVNPELKRPQLLYRSENIIEKNFKVIALVICCFNRKTNKFNVKYTTRIIPRKIFFHNGRGQKNLYMVKIYFHYINTLI